MKTRHVLEIFNLYHYEMDEYLLKRHILIEEYKDSAVPTFGNVPIDFSTVLFTIAHDPATPRGVNELDKMPHFPRELGIVRCAAETILIY